MNNCLNPLLQNPWMTIHPPMLYAGYVGCAEAIRDLAQLDLLAQIRVPTLVIAGSHDEATPPALSVQLCEGIAGARLVSLEAAHQSALEQPDTFCDAWLAFTAA